MSTAAHRRSAGAATVARWLVIAFAAVAMVVVLNGNLGSAGLLSSTTASDPATIDRISPDSAGPALVPQRVTSGRAILALPSMGVLAAMAIAAIGLVAVAITDRRLLPRPAWATTARRGRAPPR